MEFTIGETLAEMEKTCQAAGLPSYRAKQIAEGIYRQGINSWDELTVLPLELRQKLVPLATPKVVEKQRSSDKTVKYLLEFADRQKVEAVSLTYATGKTVCVSTQAGCRMGCKFCASTIGGCTRDLTAGEMMAQVSAILREEEGAKGLGGVVLMGTGEPLDNYGQTMKFIHLLTASYGLGMSPRRITISTCGLVPGILRLANEGMPLTLAVSLHGAQDQLRSKLVPINRKYPLKELMAACETFFQETGRRVTFEYALLAGVNDDLAEAEKLAKLVPKGWGHVNLLPVNPIPGGAYHPPTKEKIDLFVQVLRRSGLAVTVRRSLGKKVGAACGQLRAYRS